MHAGGAVPHSGRQALEECLPLRGRWLRLFLRVSGALLFGWGMLAWLALSEVLPHLASARSSSVTYAPEWRLREHSGPWSRTGSDFVLELGPARLAYRYPPRGHRNPVEFPIRAGMFLAWVAFPFLWARWRLPGPAFRRAAIAWGLALPVLCFPLALACGPMGCRTITPASILTWAVLRI